MRSVGLGRSSKNSTEGQASGCRNTKGRQRHDIKGGNLTFGRRQQESHHPGTDLQMEKTLKAQGALRHIGRQKASDMVALDANSAGLTCCVQV